jgi:hypothetical protein
MVLVGCLAAACGSASNSGLFGGSGESACGSGSSCDALGTGGSRSISMTGGAANVGGQGAGGLVGTGGGEASGGTPGVGGSSDTGGNFGVGGQGDGSGGNADASTPSGIGGDRALHCPAGDYHAVLTGPYRSALGTRDVGATIDFSVSSSGGTTGSFAGPGGAKATVTGMLDCSSGALTSKIENGAYGIGLSMAHFSGTFDGTYSQATGTFGGMWTMTEAGSTTNGGNGPWSTQ